jgi:hypothetical protein
MAAMKIEIKSKMAAAAMKSKESGMKENGNNENRKAKWHRKCHRKHKRQRKIIWRKSKRHRRNSSGKMKNIGGVMAKNERRNGGGEK